MSERVGRLQRDFVAQVTALPEGMIPPACAADLIAVAEAISAGQ